MKKRDSFCRFAKLAVIFLLLSASPRHIFASEAHHKINVIVIFAHPDEGEIYAGGISAIYSKLGHNVKFLSLTNGDAGHWSMNPDSLAKRRYNEAMEAKKILGLADYEILGNHDGKLKNSQELQKIVADRIEKWKSDIVFLYYPIVTEPGGHNDNMQAGLIVHDAASFIKMEKMPLFMYMRDYFTTGFSHIPDIAFNIEDVWDTKLLAMKAHESQVVEANPHADGILDEVLKSEAKRQEYLFYNSFPFSRITPDIRLALKKWYGSDFADRIKWTEAFEFAEIGRQINNQAVAELFPMLPVPYTLPGKTAWLDTGIDLVTGQRADIRAEGEVVWKKEGYNWCGPDGNSPYTRWGKRPVPGTGVGALIGKIGQSSDYTFFIGNSLSVEACANGRLFIGINDDNTSDNAGFFSVWIQTTLNRKP
jgi:LmbE family N-acetylglucosaminyl deacetylase